MATGSGPQGRGLGPDPVGAVRGDGGAHLTVPRAIERTHAAPDAEWG
jgi:hypothetical protein